MPSALVLCARIRCNLRGCVLEIKAKQVYKALLFDLNVDKYSCSSLPGNEYTALLTKSPTLFHYISPLSFASFDILA